MNKLLITGFSALAVVSSAALADKTQKEQAQPVAKAEKKIDLKGSKAMRLTDAELDKVTAGDAQVSNGGGLTIVLNPGNADILKFNHHHIVCINCF